MAKTKQDTESYKEEGKNRDWASEKCGGLCDLDLHLQQSHEPLEARRQLVQHNSVDSVGSNFEV